MITLDELTQDVQELAPLPAAAAKLTRMAADEETHIDSIVTVIRYDEALTASVLRHANSAVSAPRYRIQNVKDAVVRIGIAKVLQIAVGSHVRGPMEKSLPEYGLGEEELWKHSVASALAAEIILRQHPKGIPPMSFTAALLHDIGKLILARHLNPAIQKTVHKLTSDYSLTYYQAEIEVMGFSHADVGSRVAERWCLGEEIAAAISEHHKTDVSRSAVTDVVRTGNAVAKTIGCGLGFEGMNLAGDPGACGRLGIGRDEFEGLSAEVASLLQGVEELHA